MPNIWAIVGVVLTVLTMFGGFTAFFGNFNAKVVRLETKVEEIEGNIIEVVAGLDKRDEKINLLVISVSQMNGSMVGLGENLKYIKGKFELQDQIIMAHVLKGSKNEG